MRFEAKHHEFKRLAAHLGNFTNLPYSLAKRHQECLCYRLQTSEGNLSSFIITETETGPGEIFFQIHSCCNRNFMSFSVSYMSITVDNKWCMHVNAQTRAESVHYLSKLIKYERSP